jgi:hypothetical protein
VTRPIKPILIKTAAGGWYIISPPDKKPRTLMELWPTLARNMIREYNDRDWLGNRPPGYALKLFGPHLWAEELVRRYKIDCKTSHRPYCREEAINKAAAAVRLDPRHLRNWMNRSKSKR